MNPPDLILANQPIKPTNERAFSPSFGIGSNVDQRVCSAVVFLPCVNGRRLEDMLINTRITMADMTGYMGRMSEGVLV
jgi:hypothetical protein